MKRFLSSLFVLLSLVLIVPARTEAACTLQVATGTYTGNGSAGHAITGVGFQPKYVMIKGNTSTAGSNSGTGTYDSLTAGLAFLMGDNANPATGWITSLDADGFTLPNSVTTNENGTAYYYSAMAGSCIKTGSYTGNGGSSHAITGVGFQPYFMLIEAASGVQNPAYKMNSTGASTDATQYMTNAANYTGGIKSFDADGFTVGAHNEVNNNTTVYYYMAIQAASNMFSGTYSGNGGTQSITGVGFPPTLVWTKGDSTDRGAFTTASNPSNSTSLFSQAVNTANGITALGADGFTLGTSVNVNRSGTTYYYTVFKATNSAAPSSTTGLVRAFWIF